MYAQPFSDGETESSANARMASANSLLVADCGSTFTKVSLLGLVEGQYRLMARGEAPTTNNAQQGDITIGITQAIQVIESITGRRFLAETHIISPEQDNGDGVDVFIATVSAGGPLRMLVLGAVSPMLEALATQAVSGLYAEIQVLPTPSYIAATANAPQAVNAGQTPAGIATSGGPWNQERIALEWERQLGRIRELQPHAALIVGMADGPAGATPLQEACQLLINASKERPTSTQTQDAQPYWSVLYAGAAQYVDATRRMLSGVAEVTRVESLVSQEQLGSISIAAGTLHERHVIQTVPGYQTLASWTNAAPVATATSLSSLIRFLAQQYAMNVTVVDVGSNATSVMLAGEQGEFIPKVNAGIGVGAGMGTILQRVGVQRVLRWLPFQASEDEIRQFVVNHMLHPQIIPTSERELQICQAFAREAIILTVEAAKSNKIDWLDADLILATGGILAHAPRYGQVVMMLLDALQPQGVTSMALDHALLIPQLGAVATVSPVAAVQVNENDAVTHRLGTCVIPFGDVQPGKLAVRVSVEYTNGRQQQVDVVGGTIEVIPLHLNEQALLSLFPAPGVDVGLGPGERARAAEEIDGGLVGLIVDARGRPFVLPANEQERQARLLQWAQALGA